MSDRPYRVYRGGRGRERADDPDLGLPGDEHVAAPAPEGERRGPVVLPPPGGRPPQDPAGRPLDAVPPARGPRRRRPWGRIVTIGLAVLGLALAAWLFLGYRAFSDSVAKANRRLERATRSRPVVPLLDPSSGLVLNNPTTILVLGRDRTGRSDSIQLIRTDPGKHLVSALAIPRDLRVAIDGHGQDKINAAYAFGGPALALRAVRAFTGLPINHVVLVDFVGIVRLVNAVGGIDIVSPERLRSDFDGHVHSFPKGPIHLNGQEALAYARIRKNDLNPRDSDVTRGVRQQQVMQGLKRKLATPSTLLRLRSVGARAADPLATDLSAFQLLQLGWVDFRSQRHLQCHLGGTPTDIAGVSFLQPVPENRTVIDEFLGNVAVAAPDRSNPFAPGCTEAR